MSDGEEPPSVEIGTHTFPQRLLHAFLTPSELRTFVQTKAVGGDADLLAKLLDERDALQSDVARLAETEAGMADTIGIEPIPADHQDRAARLLDDPLVERAFSLPVDAVMVEISKLVAPQRSVNLEYVEKLISKYPSQPTLDDLLTICLSCRGQVEPVQHMEMQQPQPPSDMANAPNVVHVFSSPDPGLRFLGAFMAEGPDPEDAPFLGAGLPAAAVVAVVGYGLSPVNVVVAGRRAVIHNGFHRLYALRQMGVTHAPVVAAYARDPKFDVPPNLVGMSREHLLESPRPVLMKDFSEPRFGVTLDVAEQLKVVTVQVNASGMTVPA